MRRVTKADMVRAYACEAEERAADTSNSPAERRAATGAAKEMHKLADRLEPKPRAKSG